MRNLAMAIHGTDVRLDHVVALLVRADGDVAITQGGCGPVTAGRDVAIRQGGCGPVRAGSVSIREGGCGPVRAEHVTIGAEGVAGVVLADEVTVEPGGVVQRQLPGGAARWVGTGAVAGGLAGLVVGGVLARRR
jgi:hypothetical protein